MSKKKRSLTTALLLMLAMSLVLSACGGGKSQSSEGTAEKPVELIWYTIGTPQKDVDKVMAEVSKYTAEKKSGLPSK